MQSAPAASQVAERDVMQSNRGMKGELADLRESYLPNRFAAFSNSRISYIRASEQGDDHR
jgi:hypothetical protein